MYPPSVNYHDIHYATQSFYSIISSKAFVDMVNDIRMWLYSSEYPVNEEEQLDFWRAMTIRGRYLLWPEARATIQYPRTKQNRDKQFVRTSCERLGKSAGGIWSLKRGKSEKEEWDVYQEKRGVKYGYALSFVLYIFTLVPLILFAKALIIKSLIELRD